MQYKIHATSVTLSYAETEDLATSSATPRSSRFSWSPWPERTAGRIFGARPGPSISPSGRIYRMPTMWPKQNLLEDGTENILCFVLASHPLSSPIVYCLLIYFFYFSSGDFFSRGSAKPDVVPGDYDAAEAAYYTAASSISNTATTSHHYQNRSSSVSATASVRYGH